MLILRARSNYFCSKKIGGLKFQAPDLYCLECADHSSPIRSTSLRFDGTSKIRGANRYRLDPTLMVYVSPPRTFAKTYAPKELLVVVCRTPRESVIDTTAFLRP